MLNKSTYLAINLCLGASLPALTSEVQNKDAKNLSEMLQKCEALILENQSESNCISELLKTRDEVSNIDETVTKRINALAERLSHANVEEPQETATQPEIRTIAVEAVASLTTACETAPTTEPVRTVVTEEIKDICNINETAKTE